MEKLHHAWLLSNAHHALALRLFLIRRAKKSIRIQTFIWGEDLLSYLILSELVEASEKGIRVEVLVDGWIGVDNPHTIRSFKENEERIACKHYNPPSRVVCPSIIRLIRKASINMRLMNHRMHAKSFIIDDKWAIVGGRNYESAYFGLDPKFAFRDREVLVHGDISKKIADVFNSFWNHPLSQKNSELQYTYDYDKTHKYSLTRFYRVRIPNTLIDLKNTFYLDRYKEWEKSFRPLQFLLRNKFRILKTDITYDPPGEPNDQIMEASKPVLFHFSNVKQEMILQSPYLVFNQITLEIFHRLLNKNGDIKILLITNSYASTDNIIAYLLALKDRSTFKQHKNISFFETPPLPKRAYSRPEIQTILCNHSKTFVIDKTIVYIGSSNFDPRSQSHNAEIGLIIEDQKFAEATLKDIEKDYKDINAHEISLEEHSLSYESCKRVFRETLSVRSLPLQLGRIIVYLLQYLLPHRLKNIF